MNLSAARRTVEESRAATARSIELQERATRTAVEAARRREEAWEIRLRARAAKDHAEALRHRRDVFPKVYTCHEGVRSFELTGDLAGRPVWATWDRGRLRADERLLTQARLLVEMGTVFTNANPPARVEATLDGDCAAVMLTLAKACDRVLSVEFEPPAQG